MNNTTIDFCRIPNSNNVTEGYWKLSSQESFYGKVTAPFLLFILMLALPWNILVVVTIIKERLYHQPTIKLLLYLVVTDIMITLIYLPVFTIPGIVGEYIFGSTDVMRCLTCRIAVFIRASLMLNSLFVVALISIDRLLFIQKPLQYKQKANKQWILVSIPLTTLLSIAVGLIPLIRPETITYTADELCFLNLKIYWFTIVLVTISSMALIVIIICNIWVICVALKNIKEVYKIRNSISNMKNRKSYIQQLGKRVGQERYKKQLHLFRVFGTLLLSNAISWFPLIIVNVLAISNGKYPLGIVSFSYVIFLSQVAVHPFFETILIADVREPLKKMVTCGLLKKKKDYLVSTRQQTHSNCFCCRSVEAYDDNHCSCGFICKLIDVAVLPKYNSSNDTPSTPDNGVGSADELP